MAKFSRYDVRNKKKNRHKRIYLNKERRIHEVKALKKKWDLNDPERSEEENA